MKIVMGVLSVFFLIQVIAMSTTGCTRSSPPGATPSPAAFDIHQTACAQYQFKDRGQMPTFYLSVVAQSYHNAICSKTPVPMQPPGKPETDALAYYSAQFAEKGLSQAPHLRKTYTLLLGLGMRESTGNPCEGRDKAASNLTADEAEAGLFQTSFNSKYQLPQLYEIYKNSLGRASLLKCVGAKNWGTGEGVEFQRMTKENPIFAADYAAAGIRLKRAHWGPINRYEVEISAPCAAMLEEIEKRVVCK